MTSKFFVIVGGTASGKTTLLNDLQQLLPSVKVVVSYTTRKIRENEIAGVDYHYKTNEEINRLKALRAVDCFRSYVLANGEEVHYALPSMNIKNSAGIDVLITDVEGLKELKRKYGNSAVGVFVNRRRLDRYNSLVTRGDNPEEINRRLEADMKDYDLAGVYCDYTLNNDFTSNTVITLKEIIKREVGSYE